jgi:hypothetical protein
LGKKKRSKNYHGLYARNFPKPLRWQVDCDYSDRMTPEERQWLSEFNDRWVGGDFRDTTDEEWPREARSEVNRSKNASRTDVYALSECSGQLLYRGVATADERQGDLDGEPTPEYLEADEYKKAVAEFRKHLAPGRRVAKPVVSLGYERARRRLARLTKEGLKEHERKQKARNAGRTPDPSPGGDEGT